MQIESQRHPSIAEPSQLIYSEIREHIRATKTAGTGTSLVMVIVIVMVIGYCSNEGFS